MKIHRYLTHIKKNVSRTRKTTLANLVLELFPLNKPYVVYMPSPCPVHNSLNIWNIFMEIHRWPNHIETMYGDKKKGKRKVQGVPQSQTAALPRPQEEEETTNPNKHKSNKRTKSTKISSLSSPSEVIAILKGLKNTRTK